MPNVPPPLRILPRWLACAAALLAGAPLAPATGDLPEDVLDEINALGKNELTLIAPGQEPPVIVLGKDASEVEKHAAQELASHLEAISGQQPKILHEPEASGAGRWIAIGKTSLNAEDHAATLEPEQFLIDIRKEGVSILGGGEPPVRSAAGKTYLRERGTLYGVYTFLENLGVRWYRPEPWGWHIPKQETVKLRIGRTLSKPPTFGGRSVLTAGGRDPAALDRWAVRLKANVRIPPPREPQNAIGGWKLISLGHAHSAKIIRPEKYLKEHPDYFALINGQRGDTGSGRSPQLCLGNPALQEEFARVVVDEATRNPQIEVIAVDPEDGTQLGRRMCSCPLCVAMDDPRHPEEMGNRVFEFTNLIARKVAQAAPHVKLGLYAYSKHTEAPTRVASVEPNVVIGLANINSWNDLSRNLHDPQSPQNRRFLDLVNRWKQVAKGPLWMREYSPYGWPGPLPMYRLLQKRIQDYRDLGFQGMIWRNEPNLGPQALLVFFKAKLQWDADLDLPGELALYYRNYYGPAAAPMQAYHEAWMEALETSRISRPDGKETEDGAGPGISSGGRGMHAVCTPGLMKRLGAFLDEAEAKARGEALYERRLKGDRAGYEFARRVSHIVSLKLTDGVEEKHPQIERFRYLNSAAATREWGALEAWLDEVRKDEDQMFGLRDDRPAADFTALKYLRRDVLQNGRYVDWDERTFLSTLGFNLPEPSTPRSSQP